MLTARGRATSDPFQNFYGEYSVIRPGVDQECAVVLPERAVHAYVTEKQQPVTYQLVGRSQNITATSVGHSPQ